MAEDKSLDSNVGPQGTAQPNESGWSELWKKEDYWAIWLGLFLMVVSLIFFLGNPPEGMRQIVEETNSTMQSQSQRAPFRTVAWYQAHDKKAKLKSTSEPFAKNLATWASKPKGWNQLAP